jgi:hypothetical protein
MGENGADATKVMGWPAIFAIVAATGIAMGLLLGLMGALTGLPFGKMTPGIGPPMGVVAAILITRRRAALQQRGNG